MPQLLRRNKHNKDLLKANKTMRRRVCKTIPPAPEGMPDAQCDEYPYNSTWEAPGSTNRDFSYRYVPGSANASAGNKLKLFYAYDRVLHGDSLLTRITD